MPLIGFGVRAGILDGDVIPKIQTTKVLMILAKIQQRKIK